MYDRGTPCVYFIRAVDTGAVKIGFTTNLSLRIENIGGSNAERLEVIRVVLGGRADERWFHNRFGHRRIRNEWFEFDEEMLVAEPEFDEDTVEPPQDTPAARMAAAIRRGVGKSRTPLVDLAATIGRTKKAAKYLIDGDVSPSFETLIELCRNYDSVWDEFSALCGRSAEKTEAEQILAEMTVMLQERQRS